jgi:hypothetical protein
MIDSPYAKFAWKEHTVNTNKNVQKATTTYSKHRRRTNHLRVLPFLVHEGDLQCEDDNHTLEAGHPVQENGTVDIKVAVELRSSY